MTQRRRVFEVPDAEELLRGVAVVVASDGPASHPRRGSHDARGYGQRPARPRRLAVPTAGLAAAGAAAAGDLRLRPRITAASPRVVGEVARPKAITAGRQQQPLINHCGTLLPSWAPPALHSPPDGTEPQLCTDVYDERCRMRYSAHQHLPDGSIQMLCPQCAGRVKTNARTRNPRRRRAGGSVPYLGGITTEHCCDGLVALNSTQLANYQNVPYGTTAWKRSYGRPLQRYQRTPTSQPPDPESVSDS